MSKYFILEQFEKYLSSLNTKSFTEICEYYYKNFTT